MAPRDGGSRRKEKRPMAPAASPKKKASVAANEDDDGCVIISPPRATPIATGGGSSGVRAAVAAPAGGGEEDGDDDDLVFVGEGRRALPLPHARYDCAEFVLRAESSSTDAALHCAHCWCAKCQTPAAQCTQWAAHCRTSAADVAAARAAERKATLAERIRAVPCRGPPAVGSAVAAQLVHWQWLQLRHTALTLLSHCGCDEDALVATLVAANEVPEAEAQQVLAARLATSPQPEPEPEPEPKPRHQPSA